MTVLTADKAHTKLSWWGLLVVVFLFIAGVSALIAWAMVQAEDTASRRTLAIPSASSDIAGSAITAGIQSILGAMETPPLPDVGEQASPVSTTPDSSPDIAAPAPLPPAIVSGIPWKANAARYDRSDSRPKIAIIVTGLGLKKEETELALNELPPLTTIGFSVYGENLFSLIQRVRARNQEALVELPLEPVYYPGSDPGPRALFTDKSWDENAKNLDWVLTQAKGSVGLLAFMGGKYLSKTGPMKAALSEIKQQGYIFVDNMASVNSVTDQVSADIKSQIASVTLLIDSEPSRSAIDARLKDLEQQARTSGYAVGLAQAYPISVRKIKEWSQTLEAKGLVLMPITAMVDIGK
ncbi:MAG: divergent polysaccharide deacetylase family protein [Alphaproteobacteria bacterium]|nr:MAG: divergent polysaccharide deacetylase family protein [Alphaproteobacteria bacterium]